MFCNFLISVFASLVAVLVSAVGYAKGEIVFVAGIIEVIVVSVVFFTNDQKAFARRVIGSLISYPLLAFISARLGLYECTFKLLNPLYYAEYGVGFDFGFGLMILWLPLAGGLLILSAAISGIFSAVASDKREREEVADE